MNIFGGNTGMTYEDIQRRKKIADQMIAANATAPRNLGEGINAIGRAIAARSLSKRAAEAEAKGKAAQAEKIAALFAPQAFAPPEPPAPPAPIETQPLAPPDPLRADVLSAIERQESGGRQTAVSPKGAGGVMQIMPPTARDPGYGVPSVYDLAAQMGAAQPPSPEMGDKAMTQWLSAPENEAVNREFGRLYYEAMLKQNGGDQSLALASYNAGPGAVQQHGGVPPFEETQNYVQSINAATNAPQPPATAPQTPPVAPSQPQQAKPDLRQLVALLDDPYTSQGQRTLIAGMIQQQLQGPEDMTPYQKATLALQQKRLEAQLSGKLNSGVNVTVQNNPEQTAAPRDAEKTASELSKADVGLLTSARDAATAAEQVDSIATQLETVLPKVGYTGPGGALVGAVDDVVGVLPGDKGARGAARSLSMEAQLTFTEKTKGAITDREMGMFKAAVPGLQQTPEGNQQIVQVMRAGARRVQERAAFYERWMQLRGNLENAQAAWQKYIRENPLISESEEGNMVLNEPADPTPYLPSNSGDVPEGVDPEDWKYFTPEERALWRN